MKKQPASPGGGERRSKIRRPLQAGSQQTIFLSIVCPLHLVYKMAMSSSKSSQQDITTGPGAPPGARGGKTALIIGASGGLGRALTRSLCDDRHFSSVIALSRSCPEQQAPQACWYRADTTDPAQLRAAADQIGARFGRLHLLINCVGTLHGGSAQPNFRPEKALTQLRLDNLQQCMQVNAFAPLAALQAFATLLRHDEGAVAVALSAMVGSIGDNQLGGWYSYRMSKAALNMGLRNAAIELGRQRHGPIVVAIHPGTTRTGLSEPFLKHHKHRSAEHSAQQILNVIASLTPEHSGRFFNWDGRELPW